MSKIIRIVLIGLFFFLLIIVRAFSSKLFYDPFINYFQNDYLLSEFPIYDSWKLFFNLLFRYIVNGIISLGIIYLIFQNKKIVFFTVKLYLILFICLIIAFFVLLKTQFSTGYLMAFYIRRLLIHPVILIVLLPAFYYQMKISKRN